MLFPKSKSLKALVCFILFATLLSSCSHRIARNGYRIKKSDYTNCDVIIKKNTKLNDSLFTKIGEIKLGESGFSASCSEKHAVEILKNEACAIKAELIIITEEKRPDLWSSCYRCKAHLYKIKNTKDQPKIESDSIYKPKTIEKRVTKDRKKNTVVLIGAVITGVLLGLLLI
ncbi:hypothetical protein [Algibacter mikhailovii]|uniref:hypothetical protein n=1 Tax=Algibacter mikhailovii TaxID=425498 RepID=UPI002494F5A0|nr:hypothetical protein [Algibacter mikhailovii]